MKTGIATVWVAGNIAARKGCGASHLVRGSKEGSLEDLMVDLTGKPR